MVGGAQIIGGRSAAVTGTGIRNQKKKVIRRRQKQMSHSFDSLPLRFRIYHMLDIEGIPNVEMSQFLTQVKAAVYRSLSLITLVMGLCIVLWTLPEYAQQGNTVFDVIILICVIVFSADWVARLVCSPSIVRSLTSSLNIVDAISLVPFWINYADIMPQGVVHWVLLLRIFRLIRALMTFRQYHIVTKTIEESTEVAALMAMMLAIALPTVGTAIFYAERGEWDEGLGKWVRSCRLDANCTLEVSPFQDAVEGLWFTATTITTLGLGDVYPVSDVGYIIGGLTMIVAVFMIAFPIMILVVNFETEKENVERDKLKQQARMGRYLQDLQKEHSRAESEAAVQRAAQHRALMASLVDDENFELRSAPMGDVDDPKGAWKPRTVNFRTSPTDVYRQALLFKKDEVRYKPILALVRDQLDHSLLHLSNSKKYPYRFKFKIALGTPAADIAARREMNNILPTTALKATRARHFHVISVHCALLKPTSQCEFLRNVRLLKAYEDHIAEEQSTVMATLELENMRCTMDGQRIRDFGYALQRCRLRITCAVVYHEPISYEVPIFLDMLRATSLVKELTARPKGLTYCTKDQLYDLVNGIHHFIDLRDPITSERYVIINTEAINVAVVNAIISGYSMLLPDASDAKEDEFLFPAMRDAAIAHENDTSPDKRAMDFHGIFTNRIARREEERSWIDRLTGKKGLFDSSDGTNDENGRDTKVLCHVTARCVVPSILTSTVALQCSSASPAQGRSLYDDAD